MAEAGHKFLAKLGKETPSSRWQAGNGLADRAGAFFQR